MRNPSENTNRPLSLNELEAVWGGGVTESRGFIGEHFTNNVPTLVDRGCPASESNHVAAFCPRE